MSYQSRLAWGNRGVDLDTSHNIASEHMRGLWAKFVTSRESRYVVRVKNMTTLSRRRGRPVSRRDRDLDLTDFSFYAPPVV